MHLDTKNQDEWWALHVDGASRASRVRIGLVLHASTREQIEQIVCLNFLVWNNEIEYEAIFMGLDLALALATTNVQIKNDS